MLDAVGGRRSRTDFQKLLFLFCQQQHDANGYVPYSFVPYKYGAFSYESYADRRRLTGHGFLKADDDAWTITASGRSVASKYELETEAIESFVPAWSNLTGEDLVIETYKLFPYFATRSEIMDQILGDDKKLKAKIKQSRPKRNAPGLVTIGYEGRSIDAYLDLLYKNGVTVLCDIRKNPISRKYGFSKKALQTSCEDFDIKYEHLPQLGIESQERQNLNSPADYESLFNKYRKKTLTKQLDTINTINFWISQGECVALTCYELQHNFCHRHCVVEVIELENKKSLEVRHI